MLNVNIVNVADAPRHWPDTFCDKGGHVSWPGHIGDDHGEDGDGDAMRLILLKINIQTEDIDLIEMPGVPYRDR